MFSLTAATVAASVELTSPTTSTAAGRCSSRIVSIFVITSAVWTAWLPEPTPRFASGSGMSRSRKKPSDIAAS